MTKIRAFCALFALALAVGAQGCGAGDADPHGPVVVDPNRPLDDPNARRREEPVPLAPDCPRSKDVLRGMRLEPITCDLDDDCPAGSSCHEDVGRCTWACLPESTSGPESCPAGQTCSCDGVCVDPSAGRSPPQSSRRAFLRFDEATVALHPVGEHGRIIGRAEVRPFLARADRPGRPVTVHFSAPAGTEISCEREAGWSEACDVKLTAGDGATIPVTRGVVFLRTTGDLAAFAAAPLRYSSADLTPATGTVRVVPPNQQPTTSVSPTSYRGYASPASGGSHVDVAVPVHAEVIDGARVLLHDESGLVLPQGRVSLAINQVDGGTWHWATTTDARGAVTTQWQARLDRDADGDVLRGQLEVMFSHGGSRVWRLHLRGGDGASLPGDGRQETMVSSRSGDRSAGRSSERGLARALKAALPTAHQGTHAFAYSQWQRVIRAGGVASLTYVNLPHPVDGQGRRLPVAAAQSSRLLGPFGYHWPTGDDVASDLTRIGMSHNFSEASTSLFDGTNLDDYPGMFTALRPHVAPPALFCLQGAPPADVQTSLAELSCASLGHVDQRLAQPCASLPALKSYTHNATGFYEPTLPQYPVWLCPAAVGLPRNRSELIETALCFDPTKHVLEAPGATASWDDTGMVGQLLDHEQTSAAPPLDLVCADGSPQRAFPIFSDHRRALDGPAGSTLSRCLDDLQRLPSGPLLGDLGTPRVALMQARAAWRESSNPSSCFSPAHFYAALAEGLEARADDLQSQRLAQRLLQQWAALHVFVAEEAQREFELSAFLARDPLTATADGRIGAGARATLARARRAAAAGWEFILSDAIAPKLTALPGEALASTDFRPEAQSALRHQTPGLPISLLEGATSLVHLAAGTIRDGWAAEVGGVQASAQAQAAEQVRLAESLEALAELLHDHAAGADEGLIWARRWSQACDEYNAGLRRAQRAIATGADDDMLLPLNDGEVPRCGTEDMSSPTARFFGASERILRELAVPALDRATAVLDGKARAAWSGMQQATLYDEVQLDELRRRYAVPITEACGFRADSAATVMTRLATRDLDLNRCFVRPGCHANQESPDCFRGTLGEGAIAVFSAKQEISQSRSTVAFMADRYERQASACVALAGDLAGDEALSKAYRTQIDAIQELRSEADRAEMAGRRAADVLSSIADPLTLVVKVVTNAVRAGADDEAIALRRQAERVEAAHVAVMEHRSHRREVNACALEAESLRDQVKVAALQIERRLTDLSGALLAFDNNLRHIEVIAAEGVAAVERETKRGSAAAIYRHWLAEDLSEFRSYLREARGAFYQAARAQDYELQQTSGLADQALHAKHPRDLQQVLLTLQRRGAPRLVHDRRPESRYLTVSLRDQVLRLADQQQLATPYRHGTAASRFGRLLASSAGTIYDEAGKFQGQGLTFALSPDILAGECAERTWRVTAAIQGHFDEAVPISARLRLARSTVFASQWCGGPGSHETPLQTGRRPGPTAGPAHEAPPAVAKLQARRDADWAQFTASSYVEGASTELLGQGLFGQYTLTFEVGETMPLDRVEDIWLRFDYTSVADEARGTTP